MSLHVAALIGRDVGAGVADPDTVSVEAQLDALMDQRDRRPVEVAAKLEIAIQRDADRPRPAEVKARGRQRAQDLALMREPLPDGKPTGGVDAAVADGVAPVRVVLVVLGLAAEALSGLEPVFRCRAPPSTEPYSRGVAGVQAVAWTV